MFGNRMVYTLSPGGNRRGLIYQSGGDDKSKNAIGCLYNLGVLNLVYGSGFECFIRFRKSGKPSFFLRIRNGDFGTRYPKSMIFEIQDWIPFALIEPIRLAINNELLDFSNIEFTSEHIKVKKETFVVTNYNDDSTYSKDMLVVYLNRQDFEYEGDDDKFYYLRSVNFTNWETFDIPLSGKYYIYEGKNNTLITEIDGMYYPNVKNGLIYYDPQDISFTGCYSVNWNNLRKYTESYATTFKVNYTGDWYYRPEDYYIPQYEVEHLINNERFLISNNPLIISELFAHHGIYIRDDIYNFNAFRFNNINMFGDEETIRGQYV